MTLNSVLWTLALGIVGGLFSSVIVSKVFLIQSNYKSQLDQVESIIRRFGYIEGLLIGLKTVLEVEHDTDVDIQHEMKLKGYKTEDEYYAAHADKQWISSTKLIETLKAELRKYAETIIQELHNISISEKALSEILTKMMSVARNVHGIKQNTFSVIRVFENDLRDLFTQYNDYRKKSTKLFIRMIIKDPLIIMLLVSLSLIILAAVLSGLKIL